jgi:hypothetical protein
MAKPQRIRGLSASSKASDSARRILAARLSDVTRWEEQVPALAPVHAMRVATRRLRQALKLFGLRELDARAKRLQDALGSLRDLQLQAEWLAPRDEPLQRQREGLIPKAEKKLVVALRAFAARRFRRCCRRRRSCSFAGSSAATGCAGSCRRRWRSSMRGWKRL